MAFPISFKRKIVFENIDCSDITLIKVTKFLYNKFREFKPQKMEVKNNAISFITGEASIARNLRNPFIAISKGEVIITENKGSLVISYDLNYWQSFYWSLLSALFLTFVVYANRKYIFQHTAIFVYCGWMLMMYGLNLVISLIKFRSFIKKVVSEV